MVTVKPSYYNWYAGNQGNFLSGYPIQVNNASFFPDLSIKWRKLLQCNRNVKIKYKVLHCIVLFQIMVKTKGKPNFQPYYVT